MLVLVLFLVNVLLLAYIIKTPNDKRNPDRNRNIIIEKLHLNEAQIVQYDSLIKIHRKGIRTSQDNMMNLKNELYSKLLNDNNAAEKDSIILEINKIQNEIEHIHIHHFEDIKAICTNEQKPSFENLTKELAELFTPPRIMKPKH